MVSTLVSIVTTKREEKSWKITQIVLSSPRSAVHHFHQFLIGQDLITWSNLKEAGKWSVPVCTEKRNGINKHLTSPSLPQVHKPNLGILVFFVNLSAILLKILEGRVLCHISMGSQYHIIRDATVLCNWMNSPTHSSETWKWSWDSLVEFTSSSR